MNDRVSPSSRLTTPRSVDKFRRASALSESSSSSEEFEELIRRAASIIHVLLLGVMVVVIFGFIHLVVPTDAPPALSPSISTYSLNSSEVSHHCESFISLLDIDIESDSQYRKAVSSIESTGLQCSDAYVQCQDKGRECACLIGSFSKALPELCPPSVSDPTHTTTALRTLTSVGCLLALAYAL